MAETIRWGILGPGNIARKFAKGLQVLRDAELVAVGSRAQERADEFGDEFDVPHRHPTYEALAEDPDVDIVYVATPHPLHARCSRLCLEGGKAVLCEKPFTLNVRQAEELAALARERRLFLMEGMWTRFWPLMGRVREMLAAGTIGEPRMLHVDFCFRSAWNPEGRLLNPDLGGGSLLDVGVYCMALAFMVFREPAEITGLADIGETGVDEQAAWVLRYKGGELALCSSAVRTSTPNEANIFGTDGGICIHSPWWQPREMDVGGESASFPLEGNGFNYEAAAVVQCLREGKTECEVMPLDESIAIMRAMDTLREQWGLTYPMEK